TPRQADEDLHDQVLRQLPIYEGSLLLAEATVPFFLQSLVQGEYSLRNRLLLAQIVHMILQDTGTGHFRRVPRVNILDKVLLDVYLVLSHHHRCHIVIGGHLAQEAEFGGCEARLVRDSPRDELVYESGRRGGFYVDLADDAGDFPSLR